MTISKENFRWTVLIIFLVLSTTFLIAGCESRQDAGVNNRDTGPADIINMPDGYSNVSHKCDGPNMVYVIYHGSSTEGAKAYGSVAVVPNDPRCGK